MYRDAQERRMYRDAQERRMYRMYGQEIALGNCSCIFHTSAIPGGRMPRVHDCRARIAPGNPFAFPTSLWVRCRR